MSEMFRQRPFPFPGNVFPEDLGVVVMKTVLDGILPALHVLHSSNNDWAIADGINDPNEAGACEAVHIWHVLASDPGLMALATLPIGYEANREAPGRPWIISRFEWDTDDTGAAERAG